MKKSLFFALIAGVVLSSCSSESTETETTDVAEASSTPTLSVAWETDTTLITPESVIYDAANQVYYVTCMGPNPNGEFDGNGYIAKIGLDGEIIDHNWVSGLNDPKGLALVGSTLYATDLNKLVTVNVETGEASIAVVDGAEYLNDAASAPNGDIIFTDTDLNTIFVKSGDETEAIFTDSTFQRLNGVFHEADRYILAGFGSGKIFTLDADNTLTTVADGMETADGIEAIGDGYFISCWDGHIYYLDSEWNKTLLNDTSADGIGAADVDYIAEKNLLVVPTFFGNKVVAYDVK